MSCDPPPPAPPELPSPPELVPPPAGRSRLVTRREAASPLTGNRECDAVTALKRGLREYLEQVSLDFAGVRVRFERVLEQWAEAEEVLRMPAAVVQARDEATYDASSLTPNVIELPLDGLGQSRRRSYLVKYAEVSAPLVIEVHASSPEERSQVSMLLEDALNPVEFMYGFQLDLPHYFNQRAVYEPVKTQQLDSEDAARRRWRPGSVFLTGQLSLYRVRSLPTLRPQLSVTVDDG